jgi:protein-S-isoprenylcysteine O-methyltransferase Ste14
MKLKGMEKLREKLPAYSGRRILLLPLGALVMAMIGYFFQITLDITPRIFSSIEILVVIEPFLPLLGTILVGSIGLALVGQLWNRKDEMRAEHGNLAYQMMIPRGATGVALVLTMLFHQITPLHLLPPGPPINELTSQWSQSLLLLIGISMEIDIMLRVVFAALFFILGALTVRGALFTFGLDYMVVVYLFFPEESEIQEHEIYSVVRHPTYFGAVVMGFAGLILGFSVYSILIFFIIYSAFRFQARREEKELVERFGDSYQEYMKKVPGLCPSPRNLRQYLKFLKPR